jgi:hypothetical protein
MSGRLMLAIALAGAVAGATVWTWTPYLGPKASAAGLERRLDATESGAAAWKRHAEGWERLARRVDGARGDDARRASGAAAAADVACRSRIAAARASSRAIEALIFPEHAHEEPALGCPARRLLDHERLRDALDPGRS